jgi:hypothetical protein
LKFGLHVAAISYKGENYDLFDFMMDYDLALA